MKVRIINQTEIRQLLPMAECLDLMSEALKALARGASILPLRQVIALPDKSGLLAVMPSYSGNLPAMGVKVISVFPGNLGTELDSHQGAVLLFETERGRLIAILDASEITAIRTAAVSGVATRVLAREDATDLAILGSGVQARTHLEAMLVARNITRVRVWSRRFENARTFAESESLRNNLSVTAVRTAQEAVTAADIICTTTPAKEPVLFGEWISPGTHINAAGAFGPTTRELDTVAMVKSRLFVDRRESTLNESGDFLIPKREGAISDAHILGELGELLIEKVRGRTAPGEITLFKSMGIAIEDLASAHYIYNKAVQQGIGTSIELGGERS